MAPKKRQQALVLHAAPNAPGLGSLPSTAYDPNVEHFKMIKECMDNIKACDVFGSRIEDLQPLPLSSADADDQVGFLAPLDDAAWEQARRDRSEYVCGVNLFWADPLEVVTPGVPVMTKAITDLVLRLLNRGPTVLEDRIEFVFPNPREKRLRKCCPEECFAKHVYTLFGNIRNPNFHGMVISSALIPEAAARCHHGHQPKDRDGRRRLRAPGMAARGAVVSRGLPASEFGGGHLLQRGQQAGQS